MKVEEIAINKLSLDPANANKHTPAGIEKLAARLRRFGQQKPIVVDKKNVVRAGNGTLQAAKLLGWKKIKAVRTQLAGSEATAFAIADNVKDSEFDEEILAAQVAALREEGFDVATLGIDQAEIDKLLATAGNGEGDSSGAGAGDGTAPEKWMVVVACRDEADQVALLEQLAADGRECRALLG